MTKQSLIHNVIPCEHSETRNLIYNYWIPAFAGMTNRIKIITIIILLSAPTYLFAQSEKEINQDSCSFKGVRLYGKIQFVESFPDLTVQVVESFPDLKVKIVNSFPDDCGEWQIVDSFPDIKVKIVESFGDIKIKFVESFPGIP